MDTEPDTSIETYEPVPTTAEFIHNIYMKVYETFDIESMQEVCAALELFGYLIHICAMTPSIELALVCLVVTNKLFQDKGLWLSDVLRYCKNKYMYILEKEVISIYFHARIESSIVIEELYRCLNMVEHNELLESIIEDDFGVEIVIALIEYGGSCDKPVVRNMSADIISRWLWSIRERYIRTVMKNPYIKSLSIEEVIEIRDPSAESIIEKESTESLTQSDDTDSIESPRIVECNNVEDIKTTIQSIVKKPVDDNTEYLLQELCDWYHEITGKKLLLSEILPSDLVEQDVP